MGIETGDKIVFNINLKKGILELVRE